MARQRFGGLLVVLLCGLALAGGCAPAGAPATGAPVRGSERGPAPAAAAVATPRALERLRISYPALTASYTTAFVARETGIFTTQGLDVELLHLPSRQASQALVAGDVDYGLFSGRTVVELLSTGADITVLAAPMLKILQSMIVTADVRGPSDLRDKRVGVTQFGSSNDYTARYLLEKAGLRPEADVTLVQLQTLPNILAGLEGRALEGGILSPPISLQAQTMGFRELASMRDEPFQYPAVVLVARGGSVREQPDQIVRLVRALTEAVKRTRQDREAAEAAMRLHLGVDDAAILDLTYDEYAPAFERLPLLSDAAIQVAIDEVATDNAAARQITPASTMDMRFVREVEASGLLRELYP
jgi:NitT/TauT family transport system substrate-binding protein